LTQALGIGLDLNGTGLRDGPVTIHAPDGSVPEVIASAPRVGITKAIELPWRFCAVGDRNVSRPWPWSARGRRAAAA
jgi:DNA-3-methyladenine glycosylase